MICGYLVLTIFMDVTNSRGPHHPRETPVAKHVHYSPTKVSEEYKLIQDAELLHDQRHLQEHLEDISDIDLSKMTDEELEFYYFQVHDTDKNSKLDGLEMLQAILHTVHEDNTDNLQEDFEFYIDLIDKVLLEDDVNEDGFLSYVEYTTGRRKSILADTRVQPPVKVILS